MNSFRPPNRHYESSTPCRLDSRASYGARLYRKVWPRKAYRRASLQLVLSSKSYSIQAYRGSFGARTYMTKLVIGFYDVK